MAKVKMINDALDITSKFMKQYKNSIDVCSKAVGATIKLPNAKNLDTPAAKHMLMHNFMKQAVSGYGPSYRELKRDMSEINATFQIKMTLR